MHLFLFLSCKQAFISNVIYVDDRSLKGTSTPSRLSFVCPPTIPLPPFAPHFALNRTLQPGSEPLTSFEGCGPDLQRHQQAQTHRVERHSPLPFPEGCGQLKLARWRNMGWRNTRGEPGYERPIRCVTKTNHDENRGSFSPIAPSLTYH